tara:strand:+ start:156 stop:1139 length:984 start_codon:yes stop_codon:yes gene_type:complete
MKEKKQTTNKVGSGVLSNMKSAFSNLVSRKSSSNTSSQSTTRKPRPSVRARPTSRFNPSSTRRTRGPLSSNTSNIQKPVSNTSQYQSQKLTPTSSFSFSSSQQSPLLSIKPTSSPKLPPLQSDSISHASVTPQPPTLDIYSETNNLLIILITKMRELMTSHSTTNDSDLKKLLIFFKKSDSKIEDALIEIDNTKQKTLEMSLLKFNYIIEKNCSGWNAPKCAIAERLLVADLQKIYNILKLFKTNLSISDKKIKIHEFIDIFITNLKNIIDSNIYPELQQFSDNVNTIYKKLYTKGGKKTVKRKKTVKKKKNARKKNAKKKNAKKKC